jgi:hypothetical protein
MTRRILPTSFLLLGIIASVLAGGSKPYPGAKVDDKATKTATTMIGYMAPEGVPMKATVYMTTDSYEKVLQFYKALGKQLTMQGGEKMPVRKLPSGQVIKEAYVIFDGAADITSSTSWVKIQRPYVGAIGEVDGKQVVDDVRDVTAITVAEKK